MSTHTQSFTVERPVYSEADIAENPWYSTELRIYDVLAKVVESGAVSLTATAQELDTLFPTKRPAGPSENEAPESFLWEFWGIVAKVAGETPHAGPYQDRLIEFLKALRDLPNPVDLSLENWGSVKLWEDLPLLGPVFREALDTDQGINLEAFLARITQSGIASWSWLGLTAFHAAFEVEPDSRAQAFQKQGPGLDASVPRVAIWLELVGSKVYEEVKAGTLSDTKYATGGNWKNPKGFSKERWDYWKRRAGEVAIHDQAAEATKVLAKKVEHMMMALEK